MKLHIELQENSYDIFMEHGILHHVGEYINLKRKVLIITDKGIPEQYAQIVAAQCTAPYLYVVEEGENSKSFPIFETLCSNLLKHKFTRSDCVIALGGGVIGDLSGYVAASYMRGIDFIQIPTTTLSQIDSSIGGKVAINLNEVKNVIGAFYQPKMVFIDPDTLQSLPRRHFINGLVEAMKAGLIYDESLFALFELGDIDEHLDEIIYKALCVKKDVVEKDEKEQHLRKILNFGHTIGHAIESYYHLSDYLHGECVALGMLYFIEDEKLKHRVLHVYEKFGIPSDVSYDPEIVFDTLCIDKKASGDQITVVKVTQVGKAELVKMNLLTVKDMLKG